LVPSSGGAFEVTVDDEQIYSKLATGHFPSEGSVLADLGTKL
jgi:selT/selW/selH-like putative selenoprotein